MHIKRAAPRVGRAQRREWDGRQEMASSDAREQVEFGLGLEGR